MTTMQDLLNRIPNYWDNPALRAMGMYVTAEGASNTQAAEYDRLAATVKDSNPQAYAMYQAAAGQERAKSQSYKDNQQINAFQVPGYAEAQQANVQSQQQLAEMGVAEQRARADAGQNLSRMTDTFQNQTMPQLQGALGAAGQYRGTAATGARDNAATNFLNQSGDVNSALQRKLDDFTRQRTYASVGLLV
jgi:DNA-binding helix-hairpin-helix protein with protein kinase domain